MTLNEFSREFDLIYNNASLSSPGLTEYEKSVFLTDAQEELLKNYFSEKSNRLGNGLGDSPKRDIDFSNIISTIRIQDKLDEALVSTYRKVADNAILYELPSDVFFIMNEFVDIHYGTNTGTTEKCTIYPLSYEDYARLKMKPYCQPKRGTCWRFINSAIKSSKRILISEVLPRFGGTVTPANNNYICRYVRKPSPIILEALTSGFSINGISTISECELNPEIHREILNRAVEKAKAAYDVSSVNVMTQLNMRNE